MRLGRLGWGAAVAVYAAALAAVGWSWTFDYYDALLSMKNALGLTGHVDFGPTLELTRPPLIWTLNAPAAALGYSLGGPVGALRMVHGFLGATAGLLPPLAAWYFARLLGLRAAAPLAALFALNPLLLRYAPSALFDVHAAAAVILFLWACERWAARPDARSFGWLAGSYLLASLCRYHLLVLFTVPLAEHLWERRAQGWRAALTPLWLLPAVAGLGVIGALTALQAFATGSLAWKAALGVLPFVAAVNVRHDSAPASTYVASFWDQTGPAGALAAAAGFFFLLRGQRRERLAALGLLLPIGVLSLAVPTKESRYLLPLLPLYYAAIGRGALEAWRASGGAWARAGLAAAALIFWPWASMAKAVRFLAFEPSLRNPIAQQLAGLVERETPPGGCPAFEGYFTLRQQVDAIGGEQQLLVAGSVLDFYAGRRLFPPDDCDALVVKALNPPDLATPLAIVSAGTGTARRRWQVWTDGISSEQARP